ncbi:MAG: hypothetical protein AB7I30_16205 [Isosphaeraceae bacterium]
MSVGGKGSSAGTLPDASLVDLEVAWADREREASTLHAGGHLSMSLALRFYCLEIRLKTIICKVLKLDALPRELMTHDLNKLIKYTGLFALLNDPSNTSLKRSWDELALFVTTHRLDGVRDKPEGALKPGEYAAYIRFFDDPKDGVWSWLSRLP